MPSCEVNIQNCQHEGICFFYQRDTLRVDNLNVQLTQRQYKFNFNEHYNTSSSFTIIWLINRSANLYIMSCDFVLYQIIVTILMFVWYCCLVVKHVSKCDHYVLWFCSIHQNIVKIIMFIWYCCLVVKHVSKCTDYILWFCSIQQNIATIMMFGLYYCLVIKHISKRIYYILWFCLFHQIIVKIMMFALCYCLVIKHVSKCIDYILWFCTIHQNIVKIMVFVIYCCLITKHVSKSIDYVLWFLLLRSMMFHFLFLPYCPSGTTKLTINSSFLLVLFYVQRIM